MKHVMGSAILAATLVGAAPAGDAFALDDEVLPPAGSFSVERVTAEGSGCATDDAVTAVFKPDGSALLINIKPGQMVAEVGLGGGRASLVQSCRIELDLKTPIDYRFTIQRAVYRGRADLDPLVIGRQTTRYWFLGTRAPVRMAQLAGPFFGNYTLESDYGFEAVYSLCNLDRPLTIDMMIGMTNLRNPQGAGLMSVGYPTPTATYELVWSKCTP